MLLKYSFVLHVSLLYLNYPLHDGNKQKRQIMNETCALVV